MLSWQSVLCGQENRVRGVINKLDHITFYRVHRAIGEN
jgi:hypothetical protein